MDTRTDFTFINKNNKSNMTFFFNGLWIKELLKIIYSLMKVKCSFLFSNHYFFPLLSYTLSRIASGFVSYILK